MSTKNVFQWVKDNGALVFLLGTQAVAIIGVFTWLAISTLQLLEEPTRLSQEVLAKQLPTTPAAVDSKVISAQPTAAEVK